MILDRPINIFHDCELTEDVSSFQVKAKGKAFEHKFYDVRDRYLAHATIGAVITDREIFNIVDNCYRNEPVADMVARVTRLHGQRMQERG